MENIKTYKALLLAVLGLVIVVTGAYLYMKDKPSPKEQTVKVDERLLSGQVTRLHEGENTLTYRMDMPAGATSTVSQEGMLVRVNLGDALFAATYFSYEGARGYSSTDYIYRNIIPRVAGVSVTGTTTVGETLWTVAQSSLSEWWVGQVGDGQWLMVVENRLDNHDKVVQMLQSLDTK